MLTFLHGIKVLPSGWVALLVIVLGFLWVGLAYWLGNRRKTEHAHITEKDSTEPVPEGRIPMWVAVQEIANAIGDSDMGNALPRSRITIRQAALDKQVRIWGRKQIGSLQAPTFQFDTCWTEIPRDYWMTHTITGIAAAEPLNPAYPFTLQTESDGLPSRATAYADLQMDEKEILLLHERERVRDFESVARQFHRKNAPEVVIKRESDK